MNTLKAVSALVLGLGLLQGCATPSDPLAQYQQVDRWSPRELDRARQQLLLADAADATDDQRLQLAVLTAYRDPGAKGRARAQQLLDAIPSDSPAAPLRDAFQRELRLLAQREQVRAANQSLRSELARSEVERQHLAADLEQSNETVGTLKLQLEALKKIDKTLSGARVESGGTKP